MGGLNTQTQLETTGNPAMDAAKEQQTYDQLKTQGMSGAADESLEKYLRGGKNLVKEMMAKASSNPNYNRDVNTTSLDPASVAKKADLEMVKSKLSSYDAIDFGLGK